MDLRARKGGACKIAVPRLPRIANFDDLDPLTAEPGCIASDSVSVTPVCAEALRRSKRTDFSVWSGCEG